MPKFVYDIIPPEFKKRIEFATKTISRKIKFLKIFFKTSRYGFFLLTVLVVGFGAFLVFAFQENQKAEIFPTSYKLTGFDGETNQLVDIFWQRPTKAFIKDLAKDSKTAEFSSDNSAVLFKDLGMFNLRQEQKIEEEIFEEKESGLPENDVNEIESNEEGLVEDGILSEEVASGGFIYEEGESSEDLYFDEVDTGEEGQEENKDEEGADEVPADTESIEQDDLIELPQNIGGCEDCENIIPDSFDSISETEQIQDLDTEDIMLGDVGSESEDINETEELIELMEEIEQEEEIEQPPIIKKSIVFSGFRVGDSLKEEEFKKANLLFSFANEQRSGNDILLVEYRKDLNEGPFVGWKTLDVIQLSKENSNYLNKGYWKKDLSDIVIWQDIDLLQVKFTVQSMDLQNTEPVFIDSVWLDVQYNEVKTQEERKPADKYVLELLSGKKVFKVDEELNFEFKLKKKQNILLSLFSSGREDDEIRDIKVKILNNNGENIDFLEPIISNYGGEMFGVRVLKKKDYQFKPGRYNLEIEIENREEIIILNQDFVLGVLTVNFNKSIYVSSDNDSTEDLLPGEEAYIQIGVLDEKGDTVCDADLELEIRRPNGKIDKFSTEEGSIRYSGKCGENNITDVPDYFLHYYVEQKGVYSVTLKNTKNDYSILDSFEVREYVAFDVERIGPTRIFPKSSYGINLKIKANQDFNGEIVEYVPNSFEIISGNYSKIDNNSEKDFKRIVWIADLKQGQNYELSYEFDAPDIWPYVFLLGPLEIGDFKEIRNWQIASDAGNKKLEQQINIINQIYSTNSSEYYPVDDSLGLIYWDGSKYNGETVYFEAVMYSVSGAGSVNVALFEEDETTTPVTNSVLTTDSATYTKVRGSNPITLTDGKKYTVRASIVGGTGVYVKSARIIILQDAASITDTITQVEVGYEANGTNTSYTESSDGKHYYYDADVFDPSPTAYFEATLKSSAGAGPMSSAEGPHTPSTGSTLEYGVSSDWTSPGNIASSDDSEAYVDLGKSSGFSQSYYLKATGFDFSEIPDEAAITGIEVSIERRRTDDGSKGANDLLEDKNLVLIKQGVLASNNKASASTNWEATESIVVYGDVVDDLWGVVSGLTVSQVKDESNFGVALAVDMTGVTGEGDVRAWVDNITMTIGWGESQISTASAALYTTGGTYVTEVELASTSYELVRTSTSFSLTDNTEYEVRIKNSNSLNSYLANAKIILEQSGSINSLELIHEYGQDANTSFYSISAVYALIHYDNEWNPSNFAEWSYSAYFEAQSYSVITDTGAGYIKLRDTTTPADISNTELNWTSGENGIRKRTAIDIYSDLPASAKTLDNMIKCEGGTSCEVLFTNAWLIIQLSAPAENDPPSVGEVALHGKQDITLLENSQVDITVSASVTDVNGCSDISNIKAIVYRHSSYTASCSDDFNNCYGENYFECVTDGPCSSNTQNYECYASSSMYFFADPTDDGSSFSSDEWVVSVVASDSEWHDIVSHSYNDDDEEDVEVNTLVALEITSGDPVNYDVVVAGQNTGSSNQTTTIKNTGNRGMDVLLSGGSLAGDCGTIAVSNQQYASVLFNYGEGVELLDSNNRFTEGVISWGKPTSIDPITNNIYWGIGIPVSTNVGACSGTNVFTATEDNI